MAEDPDIATFEVYSRGRHFEDFEVGQTIEHHWGRTLTQADNALFATTTHAFNPLYFNIEFARAHDHGDIVLNPMLILCTVVGLSVEDLSEGGGPFLGVNEVEFHRCAHPGDTLTARSTVTDKRESKSKPAFGIVTWRSEGSDQNGNLVVSYLRTNLSLKRSTLGASR